MPKRLLIRNAKTLDINMGNIFIMSFFTNYCITNKKIVKFKELYLSIIYTCKLGSSSCKLQLSVKKYQPIILVGSLYDLGA